MRASFALALVAVSLVFTAAAFAKPSDGRIVQGRYFASGKASVAGVKVQYRRAKAKVNKQGRIKGRIEKVIINKGRALSKQSYLIRGNVGGVRIIGESFVAQATIVISDGVIVRGKFRGLADKSRRLSRYFRGTISGDPNSKFLLLPR